jgi:hypothetical protein
MTSTPFASPVEDSVPKVRDQIAVGENLDFQRKWWRFERFVWIVFAMILVCDVLGLFGRGWLANAKAATSDNALTLDYERIERASTPSVMTLTFGSEAIHNGKISVFVSDSVVRPLGAQRIAPQPADSAVGDGGIVYTFSATKSPAVVQIALEPSFPGLHHFSIRLSGSSSIDAAVFVVP